jgi:NitT/TauT family transport system substrate-binding protein
MKRNVIFGILLLSVLLGNVFLISCDDEEAKARLSRAEREKLRIEDSLAFKVGILPTSDCDIIRRADSLGIFDSLGVDVHIRHYNALSECRIALMKNIVECAVVDSVLVDVLKDKDSVALTLGPATSLSWKMLTSTKSRIVRTEQLVDKIIATDSHGYTHKYAEMVTDSLIKKQKNVYIIQCEDLTVRMKMLTSGNVDAAFLPEPFASAAIKSGARVLRDYSAQTKGVIAFRKKALADKRIKKQQELFLKGLEIAKKASPPALPSREGAGAPMKN